MEERVVRRYSESFKRSVVGELESGPFSSLREASVHLFSSSAVRNSGGNDVDYFGTWLTFVF
jgi:hypothetical protein